MRRYREDDLIDEGVDDPPEMTRIKGCVDIYRKARCMLLYSMMRCEYGPTFRRMSLIGELTASILGDGEP